MNSINKEKYPFYFKLAIINIAVITSFYVLYVGQQIVLPVVYAVIIAILLDPLVNTLVRLKVPRTIAITIALLVSIFFIIGVCLVVYYQFTMLSDVYPALGKKLAMHLSELVYWVSINFNVRVRAINTWIVDFENKTISEFFIKEKLNDVVQMVVVGTLMPVYLFLILYYKSLFVEFVNRLFSSEHHVKVTKVLSDSKNVIQSYLIGLCIEMVIVAILNSAGLLILGIEYAIVLGITGAILNIIPYIGGVVSTALPMIIAYVTKDSLVYSLMVLLLYLLVQFIDNNYILPKIVAARVRLNAMVSIVVVLIGGVLWGVSGMFLSIPLTAILKVVFDHIESLKPWGFLLGNTLPKISAPSKTKEL